MDFSTSFVELNSASLRRNLVNVMCKTNVRAAVWNGVLWKTGRRAAPASASLKRKNHVEVPFTIKELCELWVFGDIYRIPLFKSAVTDAICHILSQGDDPRGPIDVIPYVYKNTVRGDKLRLLFVRFFTNTTINGELWRTVYNQPGALPPEFLQEILAVITGELYIAFLREPICPFPDYKHFHKQQLCDYHDHSTVQEGLGASSKRPNETLVLIVSPKDLIKQRGDGTQADQPQIEAGSQDELVAEPQNGIPAGTRKSVPAGLDSVSVENTCGPAEATESIDLTPPDPPIFQRGEEFVTWTFSYNGARRTDTSCEVEKSGGKEIKTLNSPEYAEEMELDGQSAEVAMNGGIGLGGEGDGEEEHQEEEESVEASSEVSDDEEVPLAGQSTREAERNNEVKTAASPPSAQRPKGHKAHINAPPGSDDTSSEDGSAESHRKQQAAKTATTSTSPTRKKSGVPISKTSVASRPGADPLSIVNERRQPHDESAERPSTPKPQQQTKVKASKTKSRKPTKQKSSPPVQEWTADGVPMIMTFKRRTDTTLRALHCIKSSWFSSSGNKPIWCACDWLHSILQAVA